MRGTCHCGRVAWTLNTPPKSATACNCTLCSRYGVLWAYGYIGHDIHTTGETTGYRRADGGSIDFHFCPTCGCLSHYVATSAGNDGRHWTAVNLRLTDPERMAALPIRHFDGLDSFDDLPSDGRTVKDMWF